MRYLLSLLATLAATVGATPAAAPPCGPDDTHDLVVLRPKCPYRVRFHLRINGQAYPIGWNQQVARLFVFLDADGDGVLSPAEARHAPSHEQWRQLSSGQATIDPDPVPSFRELAKGKHAVTRLDFQSYYGVSTAGPLRTVWGWTTAAADPVSDTLWRKLDTDLDGKLSKRELLAARRVLDTHDLDDDEILTKNELMGRFFGETPMLLSPGPAHGLAKGGLPIFTLRPGESTASLAQALLGRYNRGVHRTLSRDEIELPGPVFARLDRDGDGRLDLNELEAWARLPPDLELEVPLDGADHPVRVLNKPTAGLSYSPTRHGEAILVGNWFVEIARPRPPQPAERARSSPARSTFQSLDVDTNGYLESGEIHTPPFTHVSWMRLADRDSDGKLSMKEFTAFADLKESIQARVTTLRVDNLHRSLFRYLDQNADGRLGARELNQAWERLQRWEGSPGVVEQTALPQHFRLTFNYGVRAAESLEPGVASLTIIGVPERGPKWFRKMDRNRDGDVSRKEWLGTLEQFRAIDVNNDGLITLEEAERTDRMQRPKER